MSTPMTDWKLVPYEPTQEMLDEVTAQDGQEPWTDETMRSVYQSMLAASPVSPAVVPMTLTPDKDRAALADELLPCPFCGSKNIDPAGWATLPEYAKTPEERSGPACDDCGASAQTAKIWNARAILFPDPASTPSGHGGAAVLQQLKLAHSEMNYGTARNRIGSIINDLRCASFPNPAAGDGVREALGEIGRHAKKLRKSSDLIGPVEYANDPQAMKIWQRALYHEGKTLEGMVKAALRGMPISEPSNSALASAPLTQVAVAWSQRPNVFPETNDLAYTNVKRTKSDGYPFPLYTTPAPLPSGRDVVDPVTVEACAKLADDFAAHEQTVLDRAYADDALSESGRESIVSSAGSRQVAAEQIAHDIRALSQAPASTPATVDVTGLNEAEIEDIRAHVRGKRPAGDTYEYDLGSGWRCFHCGEMFRTPGGAELHFGKPDQKPVCVRAPATVEREAVLVKALEEIRDHWANQYDHPRKENEMYRGPYGIGVTDGHRACTIIAEKALALSASPQVGGAK